MNPHDDKAARQQAEHAKATLHELGLSDRDAAALAAAQTPELLHRLRAYRAERPAPRLAGRTVILVDDGVATGATARAAAEGWRATIVLDV